MKRGRISALVMVLFLLLSWFLTGCAGVSFTPASMPGGTLTALPGPSATATVTASPSVITPAVAATPTSKFVEMLPPTPEPICTPGASSMKVKAKYPKGSDSILIEVSGLRPEEQVYMEIWCYGSKGEKSTAYSLKLKGDRNGHGSYEYTMWHTLLEEKPVECRVYVIRSSSDIACTKVTLEK